MVHPSEIEGALKQHVLDVWFPRSLDRQDGGFFCDFDRRWRPCGPQNRLLEFQARHTLLAADASRAYPENASLREAALHGWRYLRDVLWDRDHGGWFHSVDRSGTPIEDHTKHTHGMAYALSACASLYTLTGDQEVARHALDGLHWMDAHARDREHGGYFGYLRRDGSVIERSSASPTDIALDTVGTEIGLKDLNVHSDLLESFAMLYAATRDPVVLERLREAVDIITDRMANITTGALHFYVTADWRALPHLIRVGYQCHSAYRLLLAEREIPDDPRIRRMAIRIMDTAIRYARSSVGEGYVYAAPGAHPPELHEYSIRVPRHVWWVQMEVLKALLAVSRVAPDRERYLRLFEEQWRYLNKHFFDRRYGGVYMYGLDNVKVWQRKLGARLAPAAITRKGDVWKDASHDGRALLYCLDVLRDDQH